MKKLLSMLVMTSLSATAVANVTNGANTYVQSSVGVSSLNSKDIRNQSKIKDKDMTLSVSVGKDLGAVRYAVDYTNFGKIQHTETGFANDPNDYRKTTLKAHSLGVSAIYDLQSYSGFTPYAGVRLAANKLSFDRNYRVTADKPYYTSISAKKTQIGVGAVAGVSYAVSPQWTIDGGVEYNHLGKVDNFKIKEYGAKASLRYAF